MLEDRVTKRTQAGQDSNEFDPTGAASFHGCLHIAGCLPDSRSV